MILNLLRPLQILSALARSGLITFWWRKLWLQSISDREWGEAWAQCFILSGPIFIKLGQLLSTRQESFSEDFLIPLSRLQEDVNALDAEHAIACIEQAFDKKLESIFSSFQKQAIASASIAQVHLGCLHGGKAVVAKIIRPHVHTIIKTDIAWMKSLAALSMFLPSLRALQAPCIVKEFERILGQETNLLMEASAMAQAKRNHASNPGIAIPEVIWPYASSDVLIMEYMPGERLSQLEQLRSQGVPLKRVAQNLIQMFLKQVFCDAHFHGDLHPGNIFIDARVPTSPTLILIDFGIMGQLSLRDRYYLYANFQALLTHQYDRVARLHIESGWVPPGTCIQAFSSHARSIIEPICHKPIGEISVAQLLARLLVVGKRFNMKLLPELILLQKSLVHVESVVRQLDPDIHVWQELRKVTHHSLTLYREMFTNYLHRLPSTWLETPTPPENHQKHQQLWIPLLTFALGLTLPMASYTVSLWL